MSEASLPYFHPVVRAWFNEEFAQPSPPQAQGWPLIAAGHNVLILAPTGSGKTLAAFLQCISSLLVELQQDNSAGVRVVYISPLKALNNDIYRNLSVPLEGIRRKAEELGIELPEIRVAVRTGDTPNRERQAMLKKPPHILITTPESLSLMLASKARAIFSHTRYLIIDEIHHLFPTKRGVHLALSIEYLEHLAQQPPQRIGLSATQRPIEGVAAYLGGGLMDRVAGAWQPRPVSIVDTGQRKSLDLAVEVPVEDFHGLPEKTIWPAIYRHLLELIEQHRSTLIFANNRASAERITTNLNELAGRELARVHHGSISREVRLEVETLLKTGQLPCLVATSSLELGIDIGAIDLVIQVESPHEVARGLQRIGRAGHIVGMPSKGRVIPKTQGDLLEAAFITREMMAARIEPTRAPENCLDILAQQLVALTVGREWDQKELFATVRQAWSYRGLARSDFEKTILMLTGQYADEFTDLKPRLYWDQANGRVTATDSGRRLIYTSGGTIPDRGYYGVYLSGSSVRLGELDEVFVHERRIGDRFVLGTSTWQIEEIRQDRVVVKPASRGGVSVPFWLGEGFGRPYELGQRLGRFMHEASRHLQDEQFADWLSGQCAVTSEGAELIRDYLETQQSSAGALPSDRLLVLEEFHDELGEWRMLLHSPFGQRINIPLAMLISESFRTQGLELESIQNDDGILFAAPAADTPPSIDWSQLGTTNLEGRLTDLVSTSPMFGLLFRHNAARALVLPRGGYGHKRTPLWLSRLKAADLLQVVGHYPSFPIVVETYREILRDVFDLDGLRQLLTGLQTGLISVHHCRHDQPSPFAQTLLFNFTAFYMYQPDTPKAERRMHALNLDREQLHRLLGETELRTLLDEDAVTETVRRARWLNEEMLPRSAEQLHAWLLRMGEVDEGDPLLTHPSLLQWLDLLRKTGRALELKLPSGKLWIAAEYGAEYAAALYPETAPSGIARGEALRRLTRRYIRSHGPFTVTELAGAYGWPSEDAQQLLEQFESEGLVQRGEFRPGGDGLEWCDRELLRQMHRRSLSKARREIEPRSPEDYAAFLARWQGIGSQRTGSEGLLAALQPLMGLFLPAHLWEDVILPSRMTNYRPILLDQLVGSGLVQWLAYGPLDSLKLAFVNAGETRLCRWPGEISSLTSPQEMLLSTLERHGALFLPQLWSLSGLLAQQALIELFNLVACGRVTNDTFGPVRLLLNRGSQPQPSWTITPAMLSRMGRWGRVILEAEPSPEDLIPQLLARHGLLTREVVQREGIPWSELTPVLERWELTGKIRRGYFVQGLGGLQYADARAVDSLRLGAQASPEACALGYQDPANPWGQQFPWPESAEQRLMTPTAVVQSQGRPLLVALGEKKIRLIPLAHLSPEELHSTLDELIRLLSKTRGGKLKMTVTEYQGEPIRQTIAAEMLEQLGFKPDYLAMTYWGKGK